MAPEKHTWDKYEVHVLKELERLNLTLEKQQESLSEINVELTTLKTRASVWGTISGLVASIVVTLLTLFFKD